MDTFCKIHMKSSCFHQLFLHTHIHTHQYFFKVYSLLNSLQCTPFPKMYLLCILVLIHLVFVCTLKLHRLEILCNVFPVSATQFRESGNQPQHGVNSPQTHPRLVPEEAGSLQRTWRALLRMLFQQTAQGGYSDCQSPCAVQCHPAGSGRGEHRLGYLKPKASIHVGVSLHYISTFVSLFGLQFHSWMGGISFTHTHTQAETTPEGMGGPGLSISGSQLPESHREHMASD